MRTWIGPAATVAVAAVPIAYGLVFGDIWSLAFVAPYAVMGGVLAVRRPRNAIGWLLIGIAASLAVATPRSLDPETVTTGPVSAIVVVSGGTWAWTAAVALIMALTVIYPSGRAPARPRGLAMALFAIAVIAVLLSITAPTVPIPTSDGGMVTVENPLALPFGDVIGELSGSQAWFVLVIAELALGVVWLLARARRASGVERLQYRWLVATLTLGAITLAIGFVVTSLLGYANADPRVVGLPLILAWLPANASIVAVPIAIAVAILRYHLYDIDRIISRALTYASVTVVLFAAFASVNLVLQQWISPLLGGGAAATAVSTLVVAALFQPVRTRIQRVVDRRFHRARYDAERTVQAFAGRLRDEVDMPTLLTELRGVAVEAVEPSTTAVWLRTGTSA